MISNVILSIAFIVGGVTLMTTPYRRRRRRLATSRGRLIGGVLLVMIGVIGLLYVLSSHGGPFDFLADVFVHIGEFFSKLDDAVASLD